MQCFVISLRSEEKRRNHIEMEFGKHKISFDFYDAITPEIAIGLADNLNLQADKAYLTAAELACLMSHVKLWELMLAKNTPHIAIFEDDAYLGNNSELYLKQADWINPEWDIIKIEKGNNKAFLKPPGKNLQDEFRKIYQLKSEHWGTCGYILSQKGARSLLDYLKKEPLIAIDLMIFRDYLKKGELPVYQIEPAICIQEMTLYPTTEQKMPSQLHSTRNNRLDKNRPKGIKKFQRELNRLTTQIKSKFLYKKINFK